MLSEAVKQICFGCSHLDKYGDACPSQRDHDVCCMMEAEERVEYCFDNALELVDHDTVLKTWENSVGMAHRSWPDILDSTYRRAWIEDDFWRQQVISIINNLQL